MVPSICHQLPHCHYQQWLSCHRAAWGMIHSTLQTPGIEPNTKRYTNPKSQEPGEWKVTPKKKFKSHLVPIKCFDWGKDVWNPRVSATEDSATSPRLHCFIQTQGFTRTNPNNSGEKGQQRGTRILHISLKLSGQPLVSPAQLTQSFAKTELNCDHWNNWYLTINN